eukprot:CAMPEP_0181310002 /NCGR_PEP_ID=MMETSP1101-20121128/12335_1 /TAXON_ID=46948 /ORGANISM="Rhodomonas abbreviata, Strain Caron Lab Isolate" /LENGTH=52 /DNA_ID=CAMNT_0023416565 /DNA_START=534 /DNA_END=690 /DNA_ORIENTATION=+
MTRARAAAAESRATATGHWPVHRRACPGVFHDSDLPVICKVATPMKRSFHTW